MKFFLSLLTFIGLLSAFDPVFAQTQETERIKLQREIIYEKPTLQELSRLYWSLSALEPENDAHIDNYLLINECDIYKEYRNNEFEWVKIREATRQYLKENYKNFTRRIEFMQPLYLEEYDLERNVFKIVEEYRRPSSRRMEVLTSKHAEPVCGIYGELEGYPKGMVVELTRPFGFTEIPVERDTAKEYITEKLEQFNKLPDHMQTRKKFAESRDAYIWLQVRIFGFKERTRMPEGYALNSVFAVLEGMEIYGDRERRKILHSGAFNFYGKPSDFEQKLRDQYQAMVSGKEKEENLQDVSKGVGLLHLADQIVNANAANDLEDDG